MPRKVRDVTVAHHRGPVGDGTALVTGASSGLGREFARQLSACGWPVLAVARRGDRLDTLAAEARAAGAAPIHPIVLDLTGPDAVSRLVERSREVGPVDWLVNNAGVARAGAFAHMPATAHVDQVRTNCEATLSVTAAFLPGMLARRRGIILNIGSLSGFQPTPGFAVYGATKGFLLSFSEALREELRGTGVQVSILCAPSVTTELLMHGVAAGVPRRRMVLEVSPERCVREALAGAERGGLLLFVNRSDRVLATVTRFAPRALVARIARRLSLWWVGLPALEQLPPWRPGEAADRDHRTPD